jgi:hypothetical protein
MGLALLLSKAYREEFYGQKDATLTGQEMAKIGVEDGTEERKPFRSHGGGGHGGGFKGGRDGGHRGGPRRR